MVNISIELYLQWPTNRKSYIVHFQWPWTTPTPDFTVQTVAGATTRCGLRSTAITDYVVPRTLSKFGERAFAHAGPAAWNRLPDHIRSQSTPATFRRHLKTFLNDFSKGCRCIDWRRMWPERRFQTVGPAYVKARSPNLESVRGMTYSTRNGSRL